MVGRQLLDTNTVLYLLADRLHDALPPAEYYISVITEMELLSYPQLDRDSEAKIHDFLGTVSIVDLADTVKLGQFAFVERRD